jgi:HD-GYP domain-containing protein (c-di-GMP phosphodiesterase class II)
MSSAQHLIRHLEDHSLSLLSEVMIDARATGGESLRFVSDDDLQLALYTVLLKVVDMLRDKAGTSDDVRPDVRAIYLRSARDMMDFIDGQSAYTAGHTGAVVEHVGKMGGMLGLSDPVIDDLETAAWLHNLGLINQSQKLAALPRTLTQDELKQARNHTTIGAEMIRPIEFLAHLVPVVRYHHTRYDGQNTPGEPAGEALPLGARLINLADAYQAMIEPRAYRPALTRAQALIEIDKGARGQFDPNLVPLAHELG